MSGPEAGTWRRLGAGDEEVLKEFLLRHEDYAAGFTSRVLRNGEIRIPGPVFGGVLGVVDSGELRGAVFWGHTGAAFPIFEHPLPPDQKERLRRFLLGGNLVSVFGPSPHVEALEEVLGLAPRISVSYRSMYRSLDETPPEPPAFPESCARVRRAGIADSSELFPLHGAYEQEEVVTAIHRFDPAASHAALCRILETEVVAVAEREGRIVATARTNARGLRTWQIGGVYVIPELRGRGWGHLVMAHLLENLTRAGKSASLFVKVKNAPARGLYESMGFRDIGPYRVDYL